MRPVPIPDELVGPTQRRVVISAPDGDLTSTSIAPVEALIEYFGGSPLYSVRVALEEDDLIALGRGSHVWVRFMGVMPVFDVELGK